MPDGKSSRCRDPKDPDIDTHCFVFVRINKQGGPPGRIRMSKWGGVTGEVGEG